MDDDFRHWLKRVWLVGWRFISVARQFVNYSESKQQYPKERLVSNCLQLCLMGLTIVDSRWFIMHPCCGCACEKEVSLRKEGRVDSDPFRHWFLCDRNRNVYVIAVLLWSMYLAWRGDAVGYSTSLPVTPRLPYHTHKTVCNKSSSSTPSEVCTTCLGIINISWKFPDQVVWILTSPWCIWKSFPCTQSDDQPKFCC